MSQPKSHIKEEEMQEGSFGQPVSPEGEYLFSLLFLGYLNNSEEWQDIHKALAAFFYHEG